MTNLITRRGAASLAAGTAATLLNRRLAAQSVQPAKIAFVGPLSGPLAAIGRNVKAGADLAVADVNAAGGIKAFGGAPVQLVLADAEDTVEKAKNAAQRLLAQEPGLLAGMGDAVSGQTLAVTELTEKAELSWMTTTFADSITERGYRYVFDAVPIATAQGQMALPTVMEVAKMAGKTPKTVAVIADSNQAIQGMVKTWREGGYDKAGLKVLSEQTYTPPVADATPLIAPLRRNKPDILFILPAQLPDLKLMLDKLSEFGMGRDVLPTFAVSGPSGSQELLAVEGARNLEGFMGIYSNWPGKGDADMVARFKALTGQPWMTSVSQDAYAVVRVFAAAFEAAGTPDRRKVGEALHKMDLPPGPPNFFNGPARWDERGRRAVAGLVIAQWQNGMPVSVHPAETASAAVKWPG